MDSPVLLGTFATLCAAIPAVTLWRNLGLYRPVSPTPHRPREPISVLIPARNEEEGIVRAVEAVLASRGVELEVLVLDDASEDGTAEAVRELERLDPRVHLVTSPPLPAGWCGKQHACWQLAHLARSDRLLFVDADVRLTPDGLAQSLDALDESGASLISGFPRQETGSWLEHLLIPLIHFVLLAFLPMSRMRRSHDPAYGAGCGQLMLVDKEDYFAADGHRALRCSLHDGIQLPRALRRAGLRTDLFDATPAASCRMYTNAADVWNGLRKNATEGLGAPAVIVPASVLLLFGQVLPAPLLVAALGLGSGTAALLAGIATGLSLAPRFAMARRFRQPLLGAVAHPIAVLLLLVIQWQALALQLLGRRPEWKGRAVGSAADV